MATLAQKTHPHKLRGTLLRQRVKHHGPHKAARAQFIRAATIAAHRDDVLFAVSQNIAHVELERPEGGAEGIDIEFRAVVVRADKLPVDPYLGGIVDAAEPYFDRSPS